MAHSAIMLKGTPKEAELHRCTIRLEVIIVFRVATCPFVEQNIVAEGPAAAELESPKPEQTS